MQVTLGIGVPNPQPIELGTVVKGDKVSPLIVTFVKPAVDGTKVAFALVVGDTVTLEMRSLERSGVGPLSPAFQTLSATTATLTDPGASWTPATNRTAEKFEAFVKFVRATDPGWSQERFLITLRTAP